jgi:HTH-type transcriptional regulator, competence development regulator
MQFHEHLKRLRAGSGIGIKKLAPELGVSYTYISKLENNEALPSADLVKKVSDYFDYSSSDLLLSAGHVPPDILEILRTHPQDAVEFLRKHFGASEDARSQKG